VRFAVNKSEALETLARLSQIVAPEPPPADSPPLPKCRDRDDQKFLELARASQADWLVSKDRAVLKLAKRTARDFGFRIAQPAPFVASFEAHIDAYEETNKVTNKVTNAIDV
jgi:predicted nucleic acid-binding protein